MTHRLLLLVATLLLSACAASRAVAPLEKGQHGVTLSFGGPLVEFGGNPVPVPFTQVGYRYGIDGKTNVHGSLHLAGLALFKVGGFDVGAARELLPADGARPRIMLDLTTYWFFGDVQPGEPKGGFRFFPDVSVVVAWDLGKAKHHLYLGHDSFFQVHPEFHYIPTLLLGTEIKAAKTVGIQLEVDWHGFATNTTYMTPVWYGPGNLGAVGVKLGVNVYIPTREQREQREARRAPGPLEDNRAPPPMPDPMPPGSGAEDVPDPLPPENAPPEAP